MVDGLQRYDKREARDPLAEALGAVGVEEARERGRDDRARARAAPRSPARTRAAARRSRARARRTKPSAACESERARRAVRITATIASASVSAAVGGVEHAVGERRDLTVEHRARTAPAGRGSSGRRWPGRSRPRGRRRRGWSWRRPTRATHASAASRIRSGWRRASASVHLYETVLR